MDRKQDITIVIPSYQRPESLARCVDAIKNQTVKPKDIIILQEKGPLAQIRNRGLRQVHTEFVSFIDDDVIPDVGWLESIINAFSKKPNAIGVTGPSIITPEYVVNRDLFKYKRIKQLHDFLFVDSWLVDKPGHFSRSGAISTASSEESNKYEGVVQYLEACNMSFFTEAVKAVGGFDEIYDGVGEWSEPDLCFRLQAEFGASGEFYYSQRVRLEHQPSRSGAYSLRKDRGSRIRNYRTFSRRWIAPSWRHRFYLGFIRGYYGWKLVSRQ